MPQSLFFITLIILFKLILSLPSLQDRFSNFIICGPQIFSVLLMEIALQSCLLTPSLSSLPVLGLLLVRGSLCQRFMKSEIVPRSLLGPITNVAYFRRVAAAHQLSYSSIFAWPLLCHVPSPITSFFILKMIFLNFIS
ncbi:unnamed protein product, partial [Vitis vinifera]|uniref:Uncharacterized protein n=1 Tax=Vitis vinifera TaxID=29760 RepID=D7T074_VITVI